MATINAPKFPTTTNMATIQKSLSIVTAELPFPQRIITKQLHFDYSFFLKANYESPTRTSQPSPLGSTDTAIVMFL